METEAHCQVSGKKTHSPFASWVIHGASGRVLDNSGHMSNAGGQEFLSTQSLRDNGWWNLRPDTPFRDHWQGEENMANHTLANLKFAPPTVHWLSTSQGYTGPPKEIRPYHVLCWEGGGKRPSQVPQSRREADLWPER